MFSYLKKLADNKKAGSLADRLRRKRFALFLEMISGMPRPLKIIDVGGTELFWERMGFTGQDNVEITLLNPAPAKVSRKGFRCVIGDGRDMKQFRDNEFDLVFSNSVIEHVGSFDDQKRMAAEAGRIAPRLFLQTPNRYFPIEPHFLFPFFQFLPLRMQVRLLMNFNLGWYPKTPVKNKAANICRSIRLLSKTELKLLFPGAQISKENFYGLTKSYIVMK